MDCSYVADSNNDRVQVFDIGQSGPMSTPNPTPTPTPTPTPPPAGDTYTYLGQQYDPAGVAPLYPAGAVADSDGTIYVASSGSDSVEKISPDGTQTRVVGGYNRPRDVALDADPGRLWVADTTSNALHLITTTGASVRSLRNIGLRAPFGIDVDGTGLYVADAYNYRVVKLRADNGAVIWSQKTCDGALDRPRDLALGEDGNVYAVDTVHNRVVVLNATTGACVRTFGSSGTAPGAYRNPRGIASDGSGGFYIAEAKGARVQHVTSQGQPISVSDSSGLNEPACVFARADEAGVCDTFANRIVMYSESGSVLGAASTVGGVPPAPTGFNQPFGAAFGTGGELYVSDMFNSRIIKFGTDGNYERTWGTFGSGNSRFQFPRGLAVTPDGQTLVVTDSENNRLSLYRPDGSFIRHVSPVGTKFGFPHQTALAPDGTYWIADTNNNRVVHMGSDGAVLSEFGGLQAPRGIALDASGDLYVSNSGANRVDKYSPAGSLLATVASSGTGDQQVRQPWNLVVVGNDLFVADGLNNRILVLRLDGSYVTQFNGDGTAAGRFDSPRGVAVGPDGTVAAVSFRSNRVTYWGPRSSVPSTRPPPRLTHPDATPRRPRRRTARRRPSASPRPPRTRCSPPRRWRSPGRPPTTSASSASPSPSRTASASSGCRPTAPSDPGPPACTRPPWPTPAAHPPPGPSPSTPSAAATSASRRSPSTPPATSRTRSGAGSPSPDSSGARGVAGRRTRVLRDIGGAPQWCNSAPVAGVCTRCGGSGAPPGRQPCTQHGGLHPGRGLRSPIRPAPPPRRVQTPEPGADAAPQPDRSTPEPGANPRTGCRRARRVQTRAPRSWTRWTQGLSTRPRRRLHQPADTGAHHAPTCGEPVCIPRLCEHASGIVTNACPCGWMLRLRDRLHSNRGRFREITIAG